MPGAHPANLVEPATPNSIWTPAPKPSSTASLRSQPILPPTATPALALYRNSAVSAKPRSADSKSGSPRRPSKLYLSKYRDAIRQIDPDHLVLRLRKMRSGQRFSYLALPPEETRALNAAYHQRIHEDQSNLIPLDAQA